MSDATTPGARPPEGEGQQGGQQATEQYAANLEDSLHGLAESYRLQKKYAEADPLYRRYLAIHWGGPSAPEVLDIGTGSGPWWRPDRVGCFERPARSSSAKATRRRDGIAGD